MRIGEVAERSGVSVDAVRLYERLGILPRAGRSSSGYRVFADDAPTRVADVKVLQSAGLSLDTIAKLMSAAPEGRHSCADVDIALAEAIDELDAQLARLSSLRESALATSAACRAGSCEPGHGCRGSEC